MHLPGLARSAYGKAEMEPYVAIIATVVVTMSLIAMGFAFRREYQQPRDLERALAETGVPTEAMILEARDTGGRLNEVPKLAFVLEVRPEGRAPYKATAVKYISILLLHKCQPGSAVKVLVDPNDQSRVAIVGL
jgi:hypothetical protein